MELKRILARDSRSANEKAIQLYGSDVLIFSSQRLDNQIELIVAVDLDAKPVAAAAETVMTSTEEPQETSAAFVPFSKMFQSASALAPLLSDAPVPDVARTLEVVAAAPQTVVSTPGVNLESQAEQLRHEGLRSQEIVELLRLEMAALRKEFSLSRQMMPWQDGLRLSPAIQQLSLAMSEVGMPAGLRALLTDSIRELDSVHEAWPVMQSLLVNALNRPNMAPPESGVHALCGPSGAGKTSMVARLAYAAAQVHGPENQALISFADQRPGAWAQMQLLAAQSGVACFRAANSDMLRTLLDDLAGKTVWIDTCGTDFRAQAELLQNEYPHILSHAVLPVDASVTSVQKILHCSDLKWSSLMLTKLDEAAYPWPLIKGLSEQSLSVSCMVGSSRIDQTVEAFDAVLLVQLALKPLMQLQPGAADAQALHDSVLQTPKMAGVTVRVERTKKPAAVKTRQTPPKSVKMDSQKAKEDAILIPTLMGTAPIIPARKKAANVASSSKVAHG
jgi:flagellar biosynthesis protein FlhF